jgi:HK97 gp10 family phage protein
MREDMELVGADRVIANFELLSKAVQNRINRKAVTKAIRPITASAKANVKIGNREEPGLLQKSIGEVIRTKKGMITAVTGPRRKFKVPIGISKRGKNKGKVRYKIATRYAHLQEFGSDTQAARPFMRPAWDANGGQTALNTYASEFAAGVNQEVQKLPKR